MSVLLVISGAALGVVIACLVAFFLNRLNVFNAKVLGSLVSIIAGGVVTAFLGAGKEYAWAGYCLGLAAGFVTFLYKSVLHINETSSSRDPRLEMLDALRRRARDSYITSEEFAAAKEAIFADIKSHPALGHGKGVLKQEATGPLSKEATSQNQHQPTQ